MRKLFTLFISMLIVLGICMPVSAEDQSSTYSVSVTPDKISLPSVTEGYAPQDPKTIIIKNTGNQTILLEDYGKDPWLVITLNKNTLEPNEEATVSIKLKDGLSAVTRSTLKGFITYTNNADTYREQARFDVTYEVKHDMIRVNAKDATHLEEGNIACWYCEYCGKYFEGGTGTNELSPEAITIPKLKDHTVDNSGWHSDETNHWNTCQCGVKLNEAEHTFEWVTDKEATATEAGLKHEECTVCSYKKAVVEISATGAAEDTAEPSQPCKTSSEPPTNTSTPSGDQTKDTSVPKTGDDSNITLWIGVLLAAGVALTGTAVYSCKRKYNR